MLRRDLRNRLGALTLALLVIGTFSRCATEAMTLAEATVAVEEAMIISDSSGLITATIEITSDFTIGKAVAQAVEEIRDFVAQQLPCAKLTLVAAKLTIEYGALAGNCTYRGMTFSGTHSIEVKRNANGDVLVAHNWSSVSNGRVSVSGTANVTWSVANGTRTVKYQLDWTRLSDGRSAKGSGERTQSVLSGGLVEGIELDGLDTFTTSRGTWTLETNAVQLRWADPAPQSGSLEIETPKGKKGTVSFARIDDKTISVTLSTGRFSFKFKISSLGVISN